MTVKTNNGYYGRFGGAYVPELLYRNVSELNECYLEVMNSDSFKAEFSNLHTNYVGRPSPLYFAKRLSEHFGARIYLKREDLNHTGSHKINNAIGQVLLAKAMGKHRIIAETGAGQHGVATATVCALMGMECVIYMGEIDVQGQQANVQRMEFLGATVVPVTRGSRTLKEAVNEAIGDWISNSEDTFYLIGSAIGPHPYPDIVLQFQSVISREIAAQLQTLEGRANPDYVIACVGGGSNAAGAFSHFIGNGSVRLVGVEASGHGLDSGESAATLTRGSDGVIHGCRTYLLQTSDGQIVEPYSISAGLDYPGIGPLHAYLKENGGATYIDATDVEAMTAGRLLTRLEGIIPAIESAHALAGLNKLPLKSSDVVVVNLSGRGDKDMKTYLNYAFYE